MDVQKQIEELLIDAWKLRGNGDYDASKQKLDQARELCSPTDHEYQGRIFHIQMQYELDHGRLEKGAAFSQQAIAAYTKANNPDRIAHATRHLADIQVEMGQLDVAEDNYRRVLEVYQTLNQARPGDVANTKSGLARLSEQLGNIDEAVALWEEIKVLYEACQILEGVRMAEQKLNELRP